MNDYAWNICGPSDCDLRLEECLDQKVEENIPPFEKKQCNGNCRGAFYTFKIKIESQNYEHGCIEDHWPYLNQDQDANPQSGTSSILQSSKWGLKGHGCSLHLQNQDREPKFGICVYQRPVTIYKSISGCQTPVRNLQRPPKPQMRT